MKTVIKSLIAGLLIPPSRLIVRYGPPGARKIAWSSVCSRMKWQRHEFAVRTRLGFTFAGNSCDYLPRCVYHFGVWEPAITGWLRTLKLSGRTFIDVGAHLGWYSLVASQLVGNDGKVVAIEASEKTFAGLQRNIALNHAKVRAIHSAVWRETTELDLFTVDDHNTGTSSLIPEFIDVETGGAKNSAERRSTRTPAKPLSDFLDVSEIESAAVLKIDTEGAEFEVLEGIAPILPRFPRDIKVLMEINPEVLRRRGHSADEIIHTMASHDFIPYALENEYQDDFYLDGHSDSIVPKPIDGAIERQTDVLFSRETL